MKTDFTFLNTLTNMLCQRTLNTNTISPIHSLSSKSLLCDLFKRSNTKLLLDVKD